MFKVNNKKSRTGSLTFLLLTLNIFNTLFSVAIVDVEQVNVSCDVVNFNTLILTGKLSLSPENLWFSGVFRGYKMGTLTIHEFQKVFFGLCMDNLEREKLA